MAKQWYVINAYSGYEKRVQKKLEERIENEQMQDFFDEILIPVEEVIDIRNGKRKITQRKFFPGYVLVKMEMNEKTWHLVKSVPNVSGFIGGTPTNPSPLNPKEVEEITQQVSSSGEKPKPKVQFITGEKVRIIEGPFTDFNGIVEEVNFERNKLRVSLQIFGRETPVELEFIQVEKIY